MDAWGVQPSAAADANLSMGANFNASMSTAKEVLAMGQARVGGRTVAAAVGDHHTQGEKRPQLHGQSPSLVAPSGGVGKGESILRGGLGVSDAVARECLVVSGALDRTLCVFRAFSGQGLHLLRRLNVGSSPRGLSGALIVGTPVEGANGGIGGTQLEVFIEGVSLTENNIRTVSEKHNQFARHSCRIPSPEGYEMHRARARNRRRRADLLIL